MKNELKTVVQTRDASGNFDVTEFEGNFEIQKYYFNKQKADNKLLENEMIKKYSRIIYDGDVLECLGLQKIFPWEAVIFKIVKSPTPNKIGQAMFMTKEMLGRSEKVDCEKHPIVSEFVEMIIEKPEIMKELIDALSTVYYFSSAAKKREVAELLQKTMPNALKEAIKSS